MAKKVKLPVASLSAPVETSNRERRRYEVDDALRTIERAEEIKCNKDLMKDVKRAAKDKIKALNKV